MSEKDEGLLKSSVSRRDFLKAGRRRRRDRRRGRRPRRPARGLRQRHHDHHRPLAATTTTAGAHHHRRRHRPARPRPRVSASAEAGREVKIGFVTPQTGGLASFGVPDKYCVDRATEAIGDGVVCGDGKKHPVTIVIRTASPTPTGPRR